MTSALPTRGQAPFPFPPIFQNGPRRQGFASPRRLRAPLTAPGRSETSSLYKGKGAHANGVTGPCEFT
jgi:hypothetical protein